VEWDGEVDPQADGDVRAVDLMAGEADEDSILAQGDM